MSVVCRRSVFPAVLLLVMAVLVLPLSAQETAFAQTFPAQGESQEAAFVQTLVPKEVYVGDTAQLSYSFQSSVDLYALAQAGGGASKIEGGILYFDISDGFFAAMEPYCSVTQLSLRQVGMTYTFVLNFIPWRPGKLEFMPLEMRKLCKAETDRVITLEPVEIVSLSEKLGVSTLRPPSSPLLLPGTKYIVWSLIIVSVSILVLLALLLMNFSAFLKNAVLVKERIGYRKNAFLTKRKLKGLVKKDCPDTDFAQAWQQIMRSYLDYRFNMRFFSITSKDIARTVSSATGDMLDIEQENAVLSIQTTFIRTDYIRYAKDSPDSRKLPSRDHEAAFAPGEKEQLIGLTVGDIEELEKDREEFKSYGRV